MAETFLQRKQRQSFWSTLLLSLLQNKTASVLIVFVVAASVVFVTPYTPLAEKLGALRRRERPTWQGLEAALSRARQGGSAGGNWSALLGRAPAAAAVPNSVDWIRGGPAELSAVKSVAGIVDPQSEEARGGAEVALKPGDLGGARAGLAGAASADPAGGAYAGPTFFNGKGGAAGAGSDDLIRQGMDGLAPAPVPSGTRRGRPSGHMSASRAKEVVARGMSGALGAESLNHLALSQLAAGNGLGMLGTEYCLPPRCPGEAGAVKLGAIYDGNPAGGGSPSTAGALAGPLPDPVRVPSPSDPSPRADTAGAADCMSAVAACGATQQSLLAHASGDQEELDSLLSRLPRACGDPCHCGPCNKLKVQIQGLCSGDVAATAMKVSSPCVLPSNCAGLGVSPPSAPAVPAQDLCAMDLGQCGCGSFVCSMKCLL